jgi:hypothetical protein
VQQLVKRGRFSGLTVALVVLALAGISLGDPSSGAASPGGLLNPGFESGLAGWTATAADVALVVGTDSSTQCPTYTDMGVASVQPFKGLKALRLGGCKKINESQNRGDNKASQTFTADAALLRFSFRLYSWEHRGYDLFSFDLKSDNQSIGTLANTVVVPIAGVPGGARTCSGALPCSFSIDAGKRNQFVATQWITVAIEIPQAYIGQNLTLSYVVVGAKDNAHATWAYFDNVNTPPVARYIHEFAGELLEGDLVQFTDTSFDPDQPVDSIVSWRWEINGETINERNPVSVFPDEGTYSACLTVTDTFGDTNRACAGVRATDGTQISPLTLDNADPGVNAINIETLAEQPVGLFGRVLEPGWEDDLAAEWQIGGQSPDATVTDDKLAFLSTGIVTGELPALTSPPMPIPPATPSLTILEGTLTVHDLDAVTGLPDGGEGHDDFQVTVIENDGGRHEPENNTLAGAPVLVSDKAHLSWIQSAGDQDIYEARLAANEALLPPGGELLVTLKGPAGTGLNADYDLVILAEQPSGVNVFQSGDSGQTSLDTGAWRGGAWRGGAWRGGAWRGGAWRGGAWRGGAWRGGAWRGGSGIYPLSQTGFNGLTGDNVGSLDITFDELGLGTLEGNVTVAAYSANLGTGEEAALVQSDVQGARFFIVVLGANGAFSNSQPYTLQIETSLPLDPMLALGPEVCAKLPLVGADLSNPPTSTLVDLNPNFPAPESANTLIITQRERIIALADDPATTGVNEGLARWSALLPKLVGSEEPPVPGLAGHPAVLADVISVPSDLYDDWDRNPCDVAEANAVALAIRGEIQARLSDNPGIQYVVLAGDDDVIPQRRIPDETIVGNEANYLVDALLKPGSPLFSSILYGYILTDDYYVDDVPTPWQGRELYVPDRPIGRLAETPEEIGAAADAFVASNGLLDYETALPPTALVTGYDFFADGAGVMANSLAAKLDTTTLISEDWTADDLRCHLLGQPPENLDCSIPSVAAPNAHFLHYAALSANGFATQNFNDILNSNEVADAVGASPALRQRVVFTMGCHPGFNVPDRAALPPDPGLGIDPALDFVQALAQQQAVSILSTGYGYGDDQGLGGTELLLAIFSGEIVKDNVVIGDALKTAKESYLLGLSSMTVYDEKSSIQATMFGLPMYEVNVPAGPGAITPAQTEPAGETFTVSVEDGDTVTMLTPVKEEIMPPVSPNGHYFTAGGDAQATAFRAIQPRIIVPIPAGPPAHGVLIKGGTFIDKGGTFTDPSGFDPVISLPTNEWLVNASEPQICLDAFWPSVPVTLNSLDPGGGGPQALVITPGQFRCTSGADPTVTGIQRLYTSLTVEILRSDPTETEPPAVDSVSISEVDATTLAVTVQASDPSGIAKIVLLKLSSGVITPIELALPQPLPASGTFTINVLDVLPTDDIAIAGQVVDGAGNVAYFTAKGANGFTFLQVNGDPNQFVTPGSPHTFLITVPEFATLDEPFFTMEFGDGQSSSGPVTGQTFNVVHTYQQGTPFPTTATVKVMDGDGRLGLYTMLVRLRCDPTGDAISDDTDYVSCDVTSTETTVTIAVRVVGTIANDVQYRINLRTTSKNAQVKYAGGSVTGPLSSTVVTLAEPNELHFTFDLVEIGLVTGGQLEWSAEAQKGAPGAPSVGFPDRMPDSGSFTFVLP